ncbi:envelope stress response membrane protein PspC [Dickeya solani]|uniref:Envelope stress response membrane protein PspC n=1 Tax=Dickeya solani TaxID=1089444 RepID=A0AAX4F6F7_9GAMM|nr:envelope stress response membrane protein PspC [Dickeya solani]MCA6999238.1 envelope stress response membrane protein PspC [Dickeya solani]MCZ0820420.1 envelope stress response membrane protein PspC [Dickeya solani]MDV6995970.1 envelope stress response membrane protein PspC [Dickeya solani]MDV7005635.1 envelope stress response membrane protein PspC [Dickeya solani]MDV7037325.1 envelope stress response membrane protein PspC [Dickeya solani]
MNTRFERKLYRLPEEGMIKGVCAGLARYFDVPVKLVRIIAVLSIFFGLFLITAVAYLILSFMLDPAPPEAYQPAGATVSPNALLDQADAILSASEQRLRHIERYITSDTYGLRSKFRQL